MAIACKNNIVLCVVLHIILCNTCEALKCFECNSANNSACFLRMPKMNAIVPVVDCSNKVPGKTEPFCRKITQTILHFDKTTEVRVTRTCGWVKHKKECYKNDNKDHLETVCQCFGDLCNAATSLEHVKMTVLASVATLLAVLKTWRGAI